MVILPVRGVAKPLAKFVPGRVARYVAAGSAVAVVAGPDQLLGL